MRGVLAFVGIGVMSLVVPVTSASGINRPPDVQPSKHHGGLPADR
jgi:hypothetical protein